MKHVNLPKPLDVWKLKGKLKQIDTFNESFYHIEGVFKESKGNTMYNEWNNICTDLE